MRSSALLAILLIGTTSEDFLSEARAKENPKDIVAAQIRRQGYQCRPPIKAERDARASRPDEAVWRLQCKGATYRVRLVPNMAAGVERLDEDSQKR